MFSKRVRKRILLIGVLVVAFNFVVPPYIRPAVGETTSRYAPRKRPEAILPIAFEIHRGIDIANQYGTWIRATKSGRVVEVGYDESAGNYVRIKHWLGFSSYYAHLAAVSVKVGKFVLKGKRIGTMGSTGRSTGPHVHFEVSWRGRRLPPNLVCFFDNARRWVLRLGARR